MAITYRTSDRIELEEVDIATVPTYGHEKHGNFVAKWLRTKRSEYTPQGIAVKTGRDTFAVYSIATDTTCHVVVAEWNPDDGENKTIRYVRAWQMSKDRRDGIVAQLLRNKGVLDKEVDMARVVTHNFLYSHELDSQAQKLYNAEDAFPCSAARSMSRFNRNVIREKLNEDLNLRSRDHGYIMSPREAMLFGEEVLEEYNVDTIRLEMAQGRQNAAAFCQIKDRSRRMFQRDSHMVIGFSPFNPICRGIVLHEIAHSLDLIEFGGFSHGPTFVLMYCELLAKHTGIGFVQAIDHFTAMGVRVANPVHSDQFFAMPKNRRKAYRTMSREMSTVNEEM